MKRPLFVTGVVFTCTTWVAFLFEPVVSLQLSISCVVTALLLFALKRPNLRLFCLILLSGALALGCYALHGTRAVVPFSLLEGQTVEVQGVLTEQDGVGRGARYTLVGDFPGKPELPSNSSMVLISYGEMPYLPGDTVRCLVRVALPEGTASQRYYQSRGFAVIGRIQGQVRAAETGNRYRAQTTLIRARERMRENLYRRLSPGNAQVVGAMVLGIQSGVDSDTYTAVNRAGTSHLLAVSGLHLSIITAFVLAFLEKLRLKTTLRYIVTVAAAFLFAALVGFSASIMRAFVMTAVMLLGRAVSRKSDSLNSLGLALLLICMVCPHWVLGKGLWLSAASTAGIVWLAPRALLVAEGCVHVKNAVAKGFLRMMLQGVAISLCAYMLCFPVLLVTTGYISVISPLANMLVAPFVTPVILGGILCAAVPSALLPMRLAAWLTDACTSMVLGVSRVLAALPFATVALDEGYMLILLAALAVGTGLLVAARADKKMMAAALALCALCAGMGNGSLLLASRDIIELAVVERCDPAVLLRSGQAVVLGAPSRYNVERLMRYLDFRGVTRISAVIAPDCPEQMDSGLLRLQERYGVDCIVGPDDAYILSQLERALPGTRVFSGGYAQVGVLGGAVVTTSAHDGDILVQMQDYTILKKDAEYAIIDYYEPSCIELYAGGALLLPRGIDPAVEPVGRHLYGETRVWLNI